MSSLFWAPLTVPPLFSNLFWSADTRHDVPKNATKATFILQENFIFCMEMYGWVEWVLTMMYYTPWLRSRWFVMVSESILWAKRKEKDNPGTVCRIHTDRIIQIRRFGMSTCLQSLIMWMMWWAVSESTSEHNATYKNTTTFGLVNNSLQVSIHNGCINMWLRPVALLVWLGCVKHAHAIRGIKKDSSRAQRKAALVDKSNMDITEDVEFWTRMLQIGSIPLTRRPTTRPTRKPTRKPSTKVSLHVV